MLYYRLLSSETVLTYTAIGVALLLAFIIIVLLTVFVGRKNTLVRDQQQAKKAFEKELAESQIEIREATLRNISWELHDNIGQLLTLAKIQAQTVKEHPERIDEVVTTIGTGLNELRALSKLINPDVIKNLSIAEAVQMEIDRFNRLEFIKSTLTVTGTPQKINDKIEIILFRILQEFFSNTIKHSKGSNLDIQIDYGGELYIEAIDNGVGFDSEADSFNGIGLLNMKNRANLIGATLEITSKSNKGTLLRINYPY